MPLIKRYPNRKLYDTEAKRYVTLDDLAAMVRAEKDVRVVDNDSGEDVTSLTLTQIILEQEKKSAGYLPSSLLVNLIRSGSTRFDHLRKSVQSSMAGVTNMGGLTELTRRRSQEFEAQVSSLFEQGKLSLEQAQSMLKLDGLFNDVLHSLNVPTQSELHALQQQVELLAERLRDLDASTAAAQESAQERAQERAQAAPTPANGIEASTTVPAADQ